MSTEIYNLKILLEDSKPKIWRRILIPSNFKLSEFHQIIQTVMGWTNSHSHQFIKDGKSYIPSNMMEEMEGLDYSELKISDLLQKEFDEISYEYDFGDNWVHNISLEEILERDENEVYPVCIAGKHNCPPEDCGGVDGYADMLNILKQPKHEDYKDFIDWLGGKFDSNFFSKSKINENLSLSDFGCYNAD